MTKPHINVTPLIDVLLVLLIVFMVVAPLRPDSFRAKIPAESHADTTPPPDTLVVIIGNDSSLTLNNEHDLGSAADTRPLIDRLRNTFAQRIANGAVSGQAPDAERPYTDAIQRTVFIKAPKHLDYGSVARVVDAAKLAGAYPISLQIDSLD
jgi:biopolymer transport protein ExbD